MGKPLWLMPSRASADVVRSVFRAGQAGHRESLQREILGATRERMVRETGEALETITAESPLLLVPEDLQWVDPSTVDLISSLARGRGAARLMEANARIALAEGNLPGAQDCIVKAVAAVENFDVPLAAWRVYATAAEFHRSTGNTRLAQRVQELSQAIVVKLANSLEEPLRQSFLAGSLVGKIAVHG